MVRRTGGTQTLWRILIVLLLSPLALVGTAHHSSVARAATATSNVAYVTDFGAGLSDPNPPNPNSPGASIFTNALTGQPFTSGNTYNGATFTDVPIGVIDANPSTALNGYDTVILYEVCSVGDPANAPALAAINTFLVNGGKVLIFDA